MMASRAALLGLVLVVAGCSSGARPRMSAEERQVNELLRAGASYYGACEYTRAESMARAALRLDPGNGYATRLLDDARRARHTGTKHAIGDARIEEWKRAMEEIRASRIPNR